MNKDLRVIKTVRTPEAINDAAQVGFWPLIKPVVPSPEIKVKYAVLQHKRSGKIEVISDFRADHNTGSFQKVIDFTYYYPYHFPNPYAAYLIPKDLQVGERVWLDDLIEDVVGHSWNQGDTYRLRSCEAVWNGTAFNLKNEINLKGVIIG